MSEYLGEYVSHCCGTTGSLLIVRSTNWYDTDGLVQGRCNSIANAVELHLSCTNRVDTLGDIQTVNEALA